MNKKLNEYTFEEIEVGMKESFQVNITESMENTFAEITGNYNPLASNEEYAATTNYKKRISPGMLTASFLSRLTGMYLPGKYALLYSQSLNFENICYIGDQITVYRNKQLNPDEFFFDYLKKEIKPKRKMGHLTILKK